MPPLGHLLRPQGTPCGRRAGRCSGAWRSKRQGHLGSWVLVPCSASCDCYTAHWHCACCCGQNGEASDDGPCSVNRRGASGLLAPPRLLAPPAAPRQATLAFKAPPVGPQLDPAQRDPRDSGRVALWVCPQVSTAAGVLSLRRRTVSAALGQGGPVALEVRPNTLGNWTPMAKNQLGKDVDTGMDAESRGNERWYTEVFPLQMLFRPDIAGLSVVSHKAQKPPALDIRRPCTPQRCTPPTVAPPQCSHARANSTLGAPRPASALRSHTSGQPEPELWRSPGHAAARAAPAAAG